MSNEKEKETTPQPIDISDLMDRFARVFRRFWYIILIFAVIFAGINCVKSLRSFTPMYESQAIFSVNSGYSADDIFTASYYDNEAAQQLAAAFPHMLNTNVMRELMMQNMGTTSINGTIKPSAVADTNMFTLTVTSSSPQDAHDILWAVIECYPQVAIYMVDNPQVIIREEPTVPTAPCNAVSITEPLKNGGMLGAIVAVILLSVIAIFSKTVTNAEQLKSLVNIPILTVLPKVVTKKRRRNDAASFVMASSDDGLAESLRSLSFKMQKQLEKESSKVILITSTLSGEGKTTVSSNLALTMVSEGLKVCLVDADIRKQSIAQRFGAEPCKHSLMDCLKDKNVSVMNCLQYVHGTSLAFLSGESIGPKHYRIDSHAMNRVLSELCEKFDYVIMDTSPYAMVADTAILSRFAKSILYVVKPDYARQTQILDCITSLYDRDISVSGFVLNGVSRTSGRYGYGYKYGYGYGYKYGYGYGRYGYGYGYGGYGYGTKKKHKSSKKSKEE